MDPKRLLTTLGLLEGLVAPGLGEVLPGLVLPDDFLLDLGLGDIKDSDDFLLILDPPLPGLRDEPNTMLLALGDPVSTFSWAFSSMTK